MKLKQLLKKLPDDSDDLVAKEIEWKGEKFNCFVKKNLSYGNTERIQRAFANGDSSVNARIVAEACSIGDEGEDSLRYELVDSWPSELVLAMRAAYDEVHAVAEEDPEQEGKGTAKKT